LNTDSPADRVTCDGVLPCIAMAFNLKNGTEHYGITAVVDELKERKMKWSVHV